MLVLQDARCFQNATKHLAMIKPNGEVSEAEFCQRFTSRRAKLCLDYHRPRAKYIDVALVELAKPSPRRTVGTPDRLNLIALEKLRQLVAIFSDDARERHSQLVTQSKVDCARAFMHAALENFEDYLVPFLAILAHQCLDIFDGGSFQRLEPIALVDFLYHADDILAPPNVSRKK